MTTTSVTYILYGVPFSQPVRAVMWLMIYKQLPFDLVMVNPGSKGEKGSRHPTFLARNPSGTIPCLAEAETGFTLGEAHAIMCYLSNRHGWADVYPDDLRRRALVDWYLHFHHRNVREASSGLVAPRIRKDLDIPLVRQQAANATFSTAMATLDAGPLAKSPFLAGASPTLADFAAYAEIGQLRPCYTNLFDFAAYPNVSRWLEMMTTVEGHDDVHVVLRELGDISSQAPSMESIKSANKLAFETIRAIRR